MITLYQFATSPLCEKVRRILHYKQLPFKVRELDAVISGELAGRLRTRAGTWVAPGWLEFIAAGGEIAVRTS